jgi:cysteine synthase
MIHHQPSEMQARASKDLRGLIGHTPVYELQDPLIPSGRRLYLKLEAFNPNLSVKDRTALGLIEAAVKRGALLPGGTIIESTSGNLGKSLAMLGAGMGFRVVVVVDPKVPKAILNWYRAYGAEVDLVDVPDGNGSFQRARIARVQELLRLHPGAYWPNQYDNLDNQEGHCNNTGPEVLSDANLFGAQAIVGSVSTGGHLCGIAKHVKRENPAIRVIAGDVQGSAIFGGAFKPYVINGLGLGWRAGNTRTDLIDAVVLGSDLHAISLCRLLAREHGLLVGGSSGIVLFAALAALRRGLADSALAILPDSGVSYLEQIYDDGWLKEHGIAPLDRESLDRELADADVVTVQ